MEEKLRREANRRVDAAGPETEKDGLPGLRSDGETDPSDEPKKPAITPGSDGEHRLQQQWGTRDRALNFYDRQVLDYLAPKMKEFISRQEFLFIATADRYGECDCTSKFGEPGFIHVLSDKYLVYPEFRGNGVYANSGNIAENPHIAMLIIDFTRDTVGLHVNGKARLVENHELMQYADKLPEDVIELINREGKKRPERWMMVEVEEAYIQCSKHIPLMQKKDKKIDWGTDNIAAKGGDYFHLMDIPLYDRVGGDKAMEIAVDLFYRKALQDDLVGRFFEDVDMESQRLKQKSFLSMAFGGPYRYSGKDLREAHKPLIERFGITDAHFDRVGAIFKETLEELNISEKEIQGMMEVIESTRDDILNR
ncbi:MAG: globin domain-containing protein [Gammaproteobacteria bacterium]